LAHSARAGVRLIRDVWSHVREQIGQVISKSSF
jgi:hypothetical protein